MIVSPISATTLVGSNVRPLLEPTLTEKDAARIEGIRAKKNVLKNIVRGDARVVGRLETQGRLSWRFYIRFFRPF
jgi:hypothetical protein